MFCWPAPGGFHDSFDSVVMVASLTDRVLACQVVVRAVVVDAVVLLVVIVCVVGRVCIRLARAVVVEIVGVVVAGLVGDVRLDLPEEDRTVGALETDPGMGLVAAAVDFSGELMPFAATKQS